MSTLFDLNDPDIQRDPYVAYRELRHTAPAYQLPGAPMWIVSRHEDIHKILLDHETYSSTMGVEIPIMSLVFKDPPDHTRLRKSINRAFTPRRIAHLAPRIELIASELVSGLEEQTEFIRQFAHPFPITVICEMLGVPLEQRDNMKRWSRDAMLANFAASGFGTPEQLDNSHAGLQEFMTFMGDVIETHRRQPRDNIISALVALTDEGALHDEELRNFCALLLIAGHETTANLIGCAAHLLASNPALSEELATQPARIPAFVEEAVRLRPPLQRIVRRATKDVKIAGVSIPANSLIMLLPGSANQDDASWSEADQCQLDRDTKGHLGFGAGIHYCMGAALARLEGKIAFQVLLRRFRTISLDPEHPPQPIVGFASGSLGWESLPLRLA